MRAQSPPAARQLNRPSRSDDTNIRPKSVALEWLLLNQNNIMARVGVLGSEDGAEAAFSATPRAHEANAAIEP